jgi:hypothetical protein
MIMLTLTNIFQFFLFRSRRLQNIPRREELAKELDPFEKIVLHAIWDSHLLAEVRE